jgi:hypothetical protein
MPLPTSSSREWLQSPPTGPNEVTTSGLFPSWPFVVFRLGFPHTLPAQFLICPHTGWLPTYAPPPADGRARPSRERHWPALAAYSRGPSESTRDATRRGCPPRTPDGERLVEQTRRDAARVTNPTRPGQIRQLREAGLFLRAISAELAGHGILARSGRPFTAS